MPFLRKAQAGGDSFGNVWPNDGAVVEVPAEQAHALLQIQDAGFEVVEPEPEPEPAPKTSAATRKTTAKA